VGLVGLRLAFGIIWLLKVGIGWVGIGWVGIGWLFVGYWLGWYWLALCWLVGLKNILIKPSLQ
jgi:hypothetical protein